MCIYTYIYVCIYIYIYKYIYIFGGVKHMVSCRFSHWTNHSIVFCDLVRGRLDLGGNLEFLRMSNPFTLMGPGTFVKKYGKSKYHWKNWLILSVEKCISPRVRQNSTGRDMLKTGFFGAVDYALHLGSSSSLAQVYDKSLSTPNWWINNASFWWEKWIKMMLLCPWMEWSEFGETTQPCQRVYKTTIKWRFYHQKQVCFFRKWDSTRNKS